MRAFVCHDFAPIEVHQVEDCQQPQPAAGQVLIRTAAAGVNFYDTLIVQGKYQIKPPRPFSPGGEVAGIVEAIGNGVTDFAPGDRVMAFMSFGAYAEYVVAPASQCWVLPETVDFKTAAAGLVTCGTAWFSLMDLAGLTKGETVLVLGAAGGVGLAAIQIARTAGATVIAAAGDDQRLQRCLQAGADHTINYRSDELRLRVKDIAPAGVDVVIDVVGGDFADAALRSMAWRGRYLVIGFASGDIPKFPGHLILLKGCQVMGVFWDELLRREPEESRRQIGQLVDHWSRGQLLPIHVIERNLDQAPEALIALANRQVEGKQIIVP